MKKYLFIVGLLITCNLSAKPITGKVTNQKQEPLFNASVYWFGTSIAVSTGENGEFEIPASVKSKKLVASFVGHLADTIEITNQQFVEFTLKETKSLDEVVVSGKRQGVMISDLKPIKIEQINTVELKKAACCDLAGCFETQSTVQPQTTNIITNSKELRILGLSGVYNQVLIDGFPMIQGLTYTYGISSIPGTLVGNIHISKGANSVVQGYESISGQINVETLEPDQSDKLFLNAYINSFSEKHFNTHYAIKKKKWRNVAAFHTVQPTNKIDGDKDNFLDLPLLTRYMFLDKWKYGSENRWGWNSTIGLRYLNESRTGGQKSFNPDLHKGSDQVYGQSVYINQPEIWTKTAYRFNNNQSIKLYASAFHQNQESFFGTVKYDAAQSNVYGNIQHELTYGEHTLNAGVSYRFMNIEEDIAFTDTSLHRTYAGNYQRHENIPGVFAENTFRFFGDKLTWIVGVRGDHHNEFGFKFTPRTLVKYDIAPKTIVRANVGTGWRTVNLFSENIGLLASSRDIVFTSDLKPEKALNMGVNLTQKFGGTNENFSGYFSADYYRTNFHNQIFPDYDTDPTKAFIGNFSGKSISNGFQAEINMTLQKLVEVKFGYNYLDVFYETDEIRQTLPFNPRHKFLSALNFKTSDNKFHVDMNMHWFGEQRLPETSSNPVEFQRPDYSKPYTVYNLQLSYNFKKIEFYTGCENVFNFRQKQPIISWENPYGPYFDTSSVWGPTRGREIYAGVRVRI